MSTSHKEKTNFPKNFLGFAEFEKKNPAISKLELNEEEKQNREYWCRQNQISPKLAEKYKKHNMYSFHELIDCERNNLSKKVKVLIMIHINKYGRYEGSKRTWIKDLERYKPLFEKLNIEFEVFKWSSVDYEGLDLLCKGYVMKNPVGKMKCLIPYLHENKKGYDWYHRLDDDGYLHVKDYAYFLSALTNDEPTIISRLYNYDHCSGGSSLLYNYKIIDMQYRILDYQHKCDVKCKSDDYYLGASIRHKYGCDTCLRDNTAWQPGNPMEFTGHFFNALQHFYDHNYELVSDQRTTIRTITQHHSYMVGEEKNVCDVDDYGALTQIPKQIKIFDPYNKAININEENVEYGDWLNTCQEEAEKYGYEFQIISDYNKMQPNKMNTRDHNDFINVRNNMIKGITRKVHHRYKDDIIKHYMLMTLELSYNGGWIVFPTESCSKTIKKIAEYDDTKFAYRLKGPELSIIGSSKCSHSNIYLQRVLAVKGKRVDFSEIFEDLMKYSYYKDQTNTL